MWYARHKIGIWIAGAALAAALAAVIVVLLSTCLLGNHSVSEATCTQDAVCTRCGKTIACATGHAFAPATCTKPRTCTRCQATEGEPLGHTLTAATCTRVAACTRCHATFGETAGHRYADATFQSPAVCVFCGRQVGDPLPPLAPTLGLAPNMQVGNAYAYTTAGCTDAAAGVTGTASILRYEILSCDATFPAVEGYEWRVVTVQLAFSGDDAAQYGVVSAATIGDYYTADVAIAEAENGDSIGMLQIDGAPTLCTIRTEAETEGGWYGRTLRFTWREGVCVPVGYDGVLFLLYDARLCAADGAAPPVSSLPFGETLVFRMA